MEHQIGTLKATVVRPAKETAPPVFLIHGLGMGRWVFAGLQKELAGSGVPSIAVDLPGHGDDVGSDPPLERVLDELTQAVDDVPGCAVLGHSGGAYLAQVVAGRTKPHSLMLVTPWPTDGVMVTPNRLWLHLARRYAMPVVGGRPVELSAGDWDRVGLDRAADSVVGQMTPLPGRLIREMVRRPHRVDPGSVRCPVLVATGKQDALLGWQTGRRVGEWFNAVIWRFDDLGHLPWFEPGALRLYRNLAAFMHRPTTRKVTEADAWAPNEGRGAEARSIDRGEEGAKRSAYGQRLGRQGDSAIARWDQNIS